MDGTCRARYDVLVLEMWYVRFIFVSIYLSILCAARVPIPAGLDLDTPINDDESEPVMNGTKAHERHETYDYITSQQSFLSCRSSVEHLHKFRKLISVSSCVCIHVCICTVGEIWWWIHFWRRGNTTTTSHAPISGQLFRFVQNPLLYKPHDCFFICVCVF